MNESGKWVNHKISTLKSGFFYHAGEWIDINGDGRKDFLTARTNAQAGSGQLVWFEHPEEGLNKLPWTEHVVTAGPDVMFDVKDNLKGYENSFIVFASEFFSKKLTVYEFGKGAQNAGKLINSRVIDSKIDQAYSVKYLDVNGDGKFELLVNNHETDNSKAGIFLYDVPADLFQGNFTKRQIASGFKNAFALLIPNMCPGFPYPIKPTPTSGTHILVAGDGDQSAHLMRPDGHGNFTREVIKNLGGTVGSITTYDFDNDGYLEFFVPNYDGNYIEVYQFYDKTTSATTEEQPFLQ